jgi:hypothetical protein
MTIQMQVCHVEGSRRSTLPMRRSVLGLLVELHMCRCARPHLLYIVYLKSSSRVQW